MGLFFCLVLFVWVFLKRNTKYEKILVPVLCAYFHLAGQSRQDRSKAWTRSLQNSCSLFFLSQIAVVLLWLSATWKNFPIMRCASPKNSHLLLNPLEWGWIHEGIQQVIEFCYRTHFAGNLLLRNPVILWLNSVFNCTLCFSCLIWLQKCIP